ncbi:amidohydrolase [Neotamlana laminarinivorans]|uniref:Amidohydrolase n=1 Tax=Neotamlana laminarinivorans TaxID=2883124 RepID=A0A9X1L2G6_9FLAO|nr:amidohydrolase [Tamlana laminarinivorans]MCB4797564.1 amidohydrolase [Tamlana laminarinivorans]
MKIILTLLCLSFYLPLLSQSNLKTDFNDIEEKVIKWRRYFHENPELSNREFNTAKTIAKHLKDLGLEVTTGVAKTGVVGILKGNEDGKVLALRADIDALPVTERTNLPFKSEVKTTFLGKDVGVMHACGHDTHIAILMGVAEILSKNKDKIKGTVKFIFQPAEEGAPEGEEGGAELMVKENVLKNPDVDAIFGLHISAGNDVGTISYKPGGIMAASQSFKVNVKGKQSHGSRPWGGIDPIMISAKIIDALQTIISREAELTNEAAVITVGKIDSGVRSNIIPESAEMIGTIRTLDYDMQKQINERMKEMVPAIAKAYRAEATIEIEKGYPITYNNPELTAQMLPTLQKVAGESNVLLTKAVTGAEDFSFFAKEVPGLYFFLGGKPVDVPSEKAAPHHTPDFYIDESGLLLGVKTFIELTFDYLNN